MVWKLLSEESFPVDAHLGTEPGQEGEYRKIGRSVWALEMDEPFTVEIAGGVLRGESGDWLLQYGDGEYGIVGGKIFEKTYVTAAP
ncbi:hypothetical protein FACS1894187_14310 [Synergistales bacterium]|nr:hypothetical protein FACS1894187_14310 [Synergistales bacterium]